MKLRLIAKTEFFPQPEIELDTKEGSQAVSEFAGRACYQSWRKPNPATATNRGYLGHILEIDHESVLEHGSCTFYVEGVSRALTHEMIRHRHFSYSQLSQRFVGTNLDPVIPPLLRDLPQIQDRIAAIMYRAEESYQELVEQAVRLVGYEGTINKKRVREAARAALPNMTETKIVITGNHRAWRDFLKVRGEFHADLEIREFAVAVFKHLIGHFPNIYQDFEVFTDEDERQSVRLAGKN